jgi:hemolysin activation/secretion protein
VAQAVEVPSYVNPGQVEKRFEQPSTNFSTPDFILPVISDVGELSDAAKRQLEQNKFTLRKVNIEGATVFTAEELEVTYKDKLGKKISLLDAQEIARNITDMYRRN